MSADRRVALLFNRSLALFFSVAPIPESTPCDLAPLRDGAPTQEEWRQATGEGTTEIRILHSIDFDKKWLRAHTLRWSPEALWANPNGQARDSLAISWDNISRIDRRQGFESTTQGWLVGGTLGAIAGAVIAGLDCIHPPCGRGFSIVWPLAVVGGGAGSFITGSRPSWVPIYCAEPTRSDDRAPR